MDLLNHPKYYKEMRAERSVSFKLQAPSSKRLQAPETSSDKIQASSDRPQAQASSHKQQAP